MSSSDLFQSNSCGPNLLSEIDNLKYDRVTASRDCNSPWSPVIEQTNLTVVQGQYQEVTCGFYRPFSSYSTGFYNAIEYGQTLNFLTGFNIFSSAVDGAPDARDYGDLISITLTEMVDGATSFTMPLVVVLGLLTAAV